MHHLEHFGHDIARGYQHHIVEEHKTLQMLILTTFLVTFVCVRFITHAIRAGRYRWLFRNVSGPGGAHIHHLVPGILLLLISGDLGIGIENDVFRTPFAIAFGIGAALTLDEFALWVHLQDVYWARAGRQSVDAVIIAASVVGLGLLGGWFWVDIGHAVTRLLIWIWPW